MGDSGDLCLAGRFARDRPGAHRAVGSCPWPWGPHRRVGLPGVDAALQRGRSGLHPGHVALAVVAGIHFDEAGRELRQSAIAIAIAHSVDSGAVGARGRAFGSLLQGIRSARSITLRRGTRGGRASQRAVSGNGIGAAGSRSLAVVGIHGCRLTGRLGRRDALGLGDQKG